jgi:hypothetical protein
MQDNNNIGAENNARDEDEYNYSFNSGNVETFGLHGAIIWPFLCQKLEYKEILEKCYFLTKQEIDCAIKEVLFFRYQVGLSND